MSALTPPTITPDEKQAIAQFRQAMIDNGFRAIRVRGGGKAPVAARWTLGEDARVLQNVSDDALSTGVLCDGLRVLDLDVDDVPTVTAIIGVCKEIMPTGPLIRQRPGSSRLALIFRAAEGAPGKRTVSGPLGKVEVLGHGQQIVVDGLHPSGARLMWLGNRSPATVPLADLPTVSEDVITKLLEACRPILGVAADNVVAFPTPPSNDAFGLGNLPRLAPIIGADELGAGISEGPFDDLGPAGKAAALRDMLGKLDNATNDPRDRWLRAVLACADAERLGCPDARQIALEWSKAGKGWTDEGAFDQAYNSFKPGKLGIGTLAHMAEGAALAAGHAAYDPWAVGRAADLAAAGVATQAPGAVAGATMPSPAQASPLTFTQAAGAPTGIAKAGAAGTTTPRHRQWVHGTDCARGYISLLSSPGGRGKSTLLLTMAAAIASGRQLLGSHIFGTGLRTLLVSAEDGTDEVARRIHAAMMRHSLSEADLDGMHLVGAENCGVALLASVKGQAVFNEAGWQRLEGALDEVRPDVLFLDPLVSLMGGVSVNDNSAAALLMGRLAKIAATRGIAIVVAHHSRKGADPASAEGAMGAASLVNLARIALSIEPMGEEIAARSGIMPSDAWQYFRVVSTKANLTPASTSDRWFRLASVELPNAEPPIYMHGDSVAVVEPCTLSVTGNAFPPAILSTALALIASANPPFPVNSRRKGMSAADAIAQAIAPLHGGKASKADGEAVLDELLRSGQVITAKVKVPRQGHGPEERESYIVPGAPSSSPPASGN